MHEIYAKKPEKFQFCSNIAFKSQRLAKCRDYHIDLIVPIRSNFLAVFSRLGNFLSGHITALQAQLLSATLLACLKYERLA